jgi:hypothetical protein
LPRIAPNGRVTYGAIRLTPIAPYCTKQLNAEALKESLDHEKALAITSLKKNETFRAETLVSVEKHLSFFETILSANCVADKIPDHNS